MLCRSSWGQPAGESTAMASLLHALLCSLCAMLSALAVWLQNGELWLRSGLCGPNPVLSTPWASIVHCSRIGADVLFQVGELKV